LTLVASRSGFSAQAGGKAQAQAQAAMLKREAEQRIAAEIELARTALTKEVTLAATQATEKLLKTQVTAEDQRGLVNTFIKSVEAQRAS